MSEYYSYSGTGMTISLPNIHAEWIREITDGLQTGEYPAFSKLIIRGS